MNHRHNSNLPSEFFSCPLLSFHQALAFTSYGRPSVQRRLRIQAFLFPLAVDCGPVVPDSSIQLRPGLVSPRCPLPLSVPHGKGLRPVLFPHATFPTGHGTAPSNSNSSFSFAHVAWIVPSPKRYFFFVRCWPVFCWELFPDRLPQDQVPA